MICDFVPFLFFFAFSEYLNSKERPKDGLVIGYRQERFIAQKQEVVIALQQMQTLQQTHCALLLKLLERNTGISAI